MYLAKLFLCLLIIGGISKVKIPPEFEGQKDLAIVIVILFHIFLPFGNSYGLALIITLLVYSVCILIENILYPQIRDEELERTQSELSKMYMVTFSYENRINELEKELQKYRTEESNERAEIHALLNMLRKIIHDNRVDLANSEQKEEFVEMLENLEILYKKPLILSRVIDIDLFNNLGSRRKQRWAIRYLKNVRKEVNFGTGFDKELQTYINILEREVNKSVSRRIQHK